MIMKFLSFIKNFFFPQCCATCGSPSGNGNIFCSDCMPEIPFVYGKVCEKCGIALSFEFPSPICGRCRERNFSFDKNIPLMEYSGFGKKTLLNIKYKSYASCRDMGIILARKIKGMEYDFDFVTSVPERPKEERKKGISIPRVLARVISGSLGIPHKELLLKVKDTKKQKELTAKQRIINVRGAYKAAYPVKDKKILLIDDVFTTGATLDECSRILKRAGAKSVVTATVAIRDRE